jgi:hypothetical protein
MLRKTLIVLTVAIMPQGMTNGYSQSYGGWGYGGLYAPRRGSRISQPVFIPHRLMSRHGNCRRYLSC